MTGRPLKELDTLEPALPELFQDVMTDLDRIEEAYLEERPGYQGETRYQLVTDRDFRLSESRKIEDFLTDKLGEADEVSNRVVLNLSSYRPNEEYIYDIYLDY